MFAGQQGHGFKNGFGVDPPQQRKGRCHLAVPFVMVVLCDHPRCHAVTFGCVVISVPTFRGILSKVLEVFRTDCPFFDIIFWS